MSGSRKKGSRSVDGIKGEIRSELRSIVRNSCELRRPIDRFRTSPDRPVGVPRHFVLFDSMPRGEVIGLRINCLQVHFPVEAISERAALLAASVWHLKDRLNHFAKATRAAVDTNAWANGSRDLQICEDIGNHKKHGHNQNFSGLRPQLAPTVAFDTSQSGLLENYYNGAIKHWVLLVTNPIPIPYRVDVSEGAGAVIGNAADTIHAGFEHWLPLIKQLGVLDGGGREEAALRDVLFPGQAN